jgi:hypothetical protein
LRLRAAELRIEPPNSDAVLAHGLAAISTATMAVFLLWRDGEPVVRSALLGMSIAAFGAMFARRRWRHSLNARATLVLSSAVLIVAVIAQPNGTDLWYYQMYGRIVVHYRESPYKHTPSEYPNDPVVKRTDHYWGGVRAEYGPVLVGLASVVAAITGSSELPARLAWQGGAMLAVFLALLLILRRTRSAIAVALVGLNPVVAYAVVNAGHADALVGLAVLVGILLARDRHDVAAAIMFTLAALIKAPVGVALVAFVAWLSFNGGIRRTIAPIVGAAATAAVAIAAAGGRAALQPAIDARSRANSVTPWNLFRAHGLDSFRGTVTDLGPVAHSIPTLALVAALVLGACVVASYIRDEEPSLVVGGALAAWLVVALYTSPWSGFWVIPALALRRRALATRLVVAWFCLLTMQTFWGSMTALYAFTGDPHATTYQHVNAALISASIAGAVVIAAALGADALVRLRAAGSPRVS